MVVTVIVRPSLALEPALFLQVTLYVVVEVGDITREPDAPVETIPPGFSVQLVAAELRQFSVVLLPFCMVVAVAVKVGFAGGVVLFLTVIVSGFVACLPALLTQLRV